MTERKAIMRLYLLWCEVVEHDADWWASHPKTLASFIERARKDEDEIESLIEAWLAAGRD